MCIYVYVCAYVYTHVEREKEGERERERRLRFVYKAFDGDDILSFILDILEIAILQGFIKMGLKIPKFGFYV